MEEMHKQYAVYMEKPTSEFSFQETGEHVMFFFIYRLLVVMYLLEQFKKKKY